MRCPLLDPRRKTIGNEKLLNRCRMLKCPWAHPDNCECLEEDDVPLGCELVVQLEVRRVHHITPLRMSCFTIG